MPSAAAARGAAAVAARLAPADSAGAMASAYLRASRRVTDGFTPASACLNWCPLCGSRSKLVS